MAVHGLVLGLCLLGAALANECSQGDPNYICVNMAECADMFGGMENLKMFCEIQGFTVDGPGAGEAPANLVKIITKPRNVTVPEGASAVFRCSADNAVRVNIQKSSEIDDRRRLMDFGGTATKQTAIQEIDEALKELEGWYTCTAYGEDGTTAVEEAYLEIRDVCANSNCEAPKTCVADPYTATYECACPSDCGTDFDPVCGTDCQSYFNECTLKKETCERGVSGVEVMSKGLCSFNPERPTFTAFPESKTIQEGAQFTFEAQASGTPDPTFTWYANDVKVGEGAVFSGTMKKKFSGNWRVQASVCMNKFSADRDYRVDMEAGQKKPLTPPKEQCCKVYGDPHVITFDKKKFDYMGVGTYIIAMDRNMAEWMVYGTFEACGDPTKQMSCVTSITIFYRDVKVQLLRMWRISNNGQEFNVPMGQSRNIGGIQVANVALEYIVTIGDTGVVAKWDGLTTSQVCVEECADSVYGLCGDANCDAENDFARRGFMNPYTQSWEAKTSSEFGNSWVVDPASATLEPEDGLLPGERTRPCDYVPPAELVAIQDRCQMVANLDAFSQLSNTLIDVEVALENCYFDTCSGLVFGAGCSDNGAATCDEEIEALIAEAVEAGMSREEAIAKYRNNGVDPACMMGMQFARDLESYGAEVSAAWRGELAPVCPSDEELEQMKICP